MMEGTFALNDVVVMRLYRSDCIKVQVVLLFHAEGENISLFNARLLYRNMNILLIISRGAIFIQFWLLHTRALLRVNTSVMQTNIDELFFGRHPQDLERQIMLSWLRGYIPLICAISFAVPYL